MRVAISCLLVSDHNTNRIIYLFIHFCQRLYTLHRRKPLAIAGRAPAQIDYACVLHRHVRQDSEMVFYLRKNLFLKFKMIFEFILT